MNLFEKTAHELHDMLVNKEISAVEITKDVLSRMEVTDDKVKANTILEINENHEISKKLEKLYQSDKQELEKYTKVLYAQARLIEGLPIENPTEISNLVCEILSK